LGRGPSEVSSHRDLADKVMKGRPGALAMQRAKDGQVGAREGVVLGQIPEQFPVPHGRPAGRTAASWAAAVRTSFFRSTTSIGLPSSSMPSAERRSRRRRPRSPPRLCAPGRRHRRRLGRLRCRPPTRARAVASRPRGAVTTRHFAPCATTVRSSRSPMEPALRTATVRPATPRASRTAFIGVESGSISAAARSSSLSGMTWTRRASRVK
jgi:hypothetical protein